MSVVEQDPVGVQKTNDHDWRVHQYMEMGFSEGEANLLATATSVSYTEKDKKRVRWETPLHHAKVKKALDQGCTRQQAMDIYT